MEVEVVAVEQATAAKGAAAESATGAIVRAKVERGRKKRTGEKTRTGAKTSRRRRGK